jgi:hypothetical protein
VFVSRALSGLNRVVDIDVLVDLTGLIIRSLGFDEVLSESLNRCSSQHNATLEGVLGFDLVIFHRGSEPGKGVIG